jgi:multidrug efflux system outer membrane protein
VKIAREEQATKPSTVRDSERLQTAGRDSALAVTDSQRAFAGAEQTLAQLETAIAEDQIAVFLALGGGWSVATEQTESRRTCWL